MAMTPIQKQRNSMNAMRVFKASMVMALLAVIMLISFSCLHTQSQSLEEAEKINFIQYTLPDDDDTVVIFETTMGTVKAVLFEEQAPKFCEYFKKLVNDGYYDGTYYFYIEDEQKAYAFAGGKAPDGNDTDDTDKEMLEPEKSNDLWPFRGALCTFGREKGVFNKRNTTGSRILFVNSVVFDDDMINEMNELDANEQLIKYFTEKGGVPNFSQQFTIFGQVYDGMDVVEKINSAEVDENKKPKQEIKIISAKLSTYGENRSDNEEEVFPESFKSDDSAADTDSQDING